MSSWKELAGWIKSNGSDVTKQTNMHFFPSLVTLNVALPRASDPTPVQLFAELSVSQGPPVPWLRTASQCCTPPGLTACLPALLGNQTAWGGSGWPGSWDKDHMKFSTLPHPIRKQAERSRERESRPGRSRMDGDELRSFSQLDICVELRDTGTLRRSFGVPGQSRSQQLQRDMSAWDLRTEFSCFSCKSLVVGWH